VDKLWFLHSIFLESIHGGRLLWRGAVESLVAAKARINKLPLCSLSSSGDYLILDQDPGQRVFVMLLGVSVQAGPTTDPCNTP
jgi:hypothetical protein